MSDDQVKQALELMAARLPKASDILNGTVTELTADQQEFSLKYAVAVSISYELKDTYEAAVAAKKKGDEVGFNKWIELSDNFLRFVMNNFPPELAIMTVRTVVSNFLVRLETKKMKSWQDFVLAYETIMPTFEDLADPDR